jgi:hypothetical protein
VKYYDMPRVRAIVRGASRQDYRLSSIVLGIVASDAFQMAEVARPDQHGQHKTAANDSAAARFEPPGTTGVGITSRSEPPGD